MKLRWCLFLILIVTVGATAQTAKSASVTAKKLVVSQPFLERAKDALAAIEVISVRSSNGLYLERYLIAERAVARLKIEAQSAVEQDAAKAIESPLSHLETCRMQFEANMKFDCDDLTSLNAAYTPIGLIPWWRTR